MANLNDGGLLHAHSRIFFHPTEEEIHDQCFDLCAVLIYALLPRLKYIKETDAERGSTPFSIEEGHDIAVTKWQNILSEIIAGFELYCQDDYDDCDPKSVETVKRATELFGKYMMNLWL
ncbi:MAG: hypothetical protein AB4041_13490 [Microcystaceae cyanobacterium]